VDVSHAAPGLDLDDMDTSVPLYLRYRERIPSFEESALVRDGRVSLTGLSLGSSPPGNGHRLALPPRGGEDPLLRRHSPRRTRRGLPVVW
jgi:hypothetical protein